MLDQPGTGEALRLQGLTARIDTEAWAGAAVDWLETRDDVDARRIGIVGWSWAAIRPARRRLREAVRAVRGVGRQPQLGRGPAPSARARGRAAGPPLLGARALGVGPRGPRHLHRVRRRRPPRGVVEKITVPFLIAHGANDRQIPLEYAHRSYEQAVNSPKRELRVFTPRRAGPSTSASTTCPRQRLHRRLGRRHLRRTDPAALTSPAYRRIFINPARAKIWERRGSSTPRSASVSTKRSPTTRPWRSCWTTTSPPCCTPASGSAKLVTGDVAERRPAATVVNCLTADSRKEVDRLVSAAFDAGGRPWLPAAPKSPATPAVSPIPTETPGRSCGWNSGTSSTDAPRCHFRGKAPPGGCLFPGKGTRVLAATRWPGAAGGGRAGQGAGRRPRGTTAG